MAKNACIVLPTYNEALTIEAVITGIFEQEPKTNGWHLSILVVDDSSPDGTGDIVRWLQKKHKDLHLLEGKKEGLGIAYIRGFNWVIEHLPDAGFAFQMDSDLSHDPRYILDFLRAADSGYDFIIGSRYMKGGSIPNWKWYRKMLSYFGNQYIRFVGGMTSVHDCTSGFRCISTVILKKIDSQKLLTRGYAFQMSLLHQALAKGANVYEIPISFTDRTSGESKLGKADILESLTTATTLRFKKY